MNKLVTELIAGDIIDPPNAEKVWLWKDGIKRCYTVVSIKAGKVTKKGKFIQITASCPSPYRDEAYTTKCQMLETKEVFVHGPLK